MAYFDIYADPPQADGRRSVHPRLVDPPSRSTEDLIASIVNSTTLTRSDIAATLSAFSDYIERELSLGGTVHLSGIGTFRVVPKFRTKKYEGDKITGKDVAYKGLVFTPTRNMVRRVSNKIQFSLRKGRHSADILEAEVVLRLKEYFTDHDNISTSQFERLMHLTNAQARRFLAGLIAKEQLERRKVGNAYLYEPNRFYFPKPTAHTTTS